MSDCGSENFPNLCERLLIFLELILCSWRRMKSCLNQMIHKPTIPPSDHQVLHASQCRTAWDIKVMCSIVWDFGNDVFNLWLQKQCRVDFHRSHPSITDENCNNSKSLDGLPMFLRICDIKPLRKHIFQIWKDWRGAVSQVSQKSISRKPVTGDLAPNL